MHTKKMGISFVEILVVVVFVVVVVSIIFPLLVNRHRHGNRQNPCRSNLRQLAMAATMYSQDNKNRLPGLYKRQDNGTVSKKYTGWGSDLITYVKGGTDVTTPSEMFYCPEMPKGDIEMPVCYGYNASLLNADGTGISEKAILLPTQVGILCDAAPGIPAQAETVTKNGVIYGGGGIVGGSSMVFSENPDMGQKLTVNPAGRHSDGVIVGYADGHAQIVPDKFNEKDSQNGVVRAFYMATSLGLVNNLAAGLGGSINQPFGKVMPAEKGKEILYIGGDPATRPIIAAACEVSRKMRTGFKYNVFGFTGSLTDDKRPADYLEGVVSPLSVPENVGGQSNRIHIGTDAMVAVVNKNCAIKVGSIDLTEKIFTRKDGMGKWRKINLRDLQTIIQSDGYGVLDDMTSSDAIKAIADSHDWQVYLQNKTDRSRVAIADTAATMTTPGGFGAYFRDGGYAGQKDYKCRGKDKMSDNDSYRGTYCRNDFEIVDKVAYDTLGIGIVSAAFADLKKVDILAITFDTGDTVTFPTSTPSEFPGIYPPTCTWPFRRNLYAYYTPGKASEAVADLAFIKYRTAFNESPMYKASFWR